MIQKFYWAISSRCGCSVAESCLTLLDPMDWSTPGSSVLHCHVVCSNSGPLIQWWHPTISLSITFFSFPQSFSESGSFPMSWFFSPGGGQDIGSSASASVLPMNIQDWFPLGWTGFISLQSEGLSRVFSNTIVPKHQFVGAQSSLWSNFYIWTWLLQKP